MSVMYFRDKDGKFIPFSVKAKSAYQSAKDGGYTGTEEEFNQKLAESVVNSLNGKTGDINLTAEDISALPSSKELEFMKHPAVGNIGDVIIVDSVDSQGTPTRYKAIPLDASFKLDGSNSIQVASKDDVYTFSLYNFDAALSGQIPYKDADGKLSWKNLESYDDSIILNEISNIKEEYATKDYVSNEISSIDIPEPITVDVSGSDAVTVSNSSISETSKHYNVSLQGFDIATENQQPYKTTDGKLSWKDPYVYNDTPIQEEIAFVKQQCIDTDAELKNRVSAIETKVNTVSNVMDFVGSFANKPDPAEYKDGNVIAVTEGDDKGKEFVRDNGVWVEFGNSTAEQAAISQLQESVAKRALQDDFKSLQDVAVITTEQSLTSMQKDQVCENIGAIRSPLTAEVGQIIKVSAVDENGVPTHWETANLPKDTGWVTLRLNREWAELCGEVGISDEEYATKGARTRYRAIGSLVQIQGCIQPMKAKSTDGKIDQTNVAFTLDPLPPELRPNVNLTFVCQSSYSGKWMLNVGVDGHLGFSRCQEINYTTTTINNTTVVTSVKQGYLTLEDPLTRPNYFPFSITYIAEN